MEWSVSLLVYVVVQFIAFLLVLVATPIGMFQARRGRTFYEKQCITLWGLKNNCFVERYHFFSDNLWWRCPGRRDRFLIARVLAIITIFLYGAAFVLGFIMLFCCPCFRWVCLALNIVGAGNLCYVLAAMEITYNKNEGISCGVMKLDYTYGAGFILFAVACGLDVLNIVFLLLPIWYSVSVECDEVSKTNGQEQEDSKASETQA